MPVGSDEIRHRWGYHPGTSVTIPKHEQVREAYIAFAEFLDRVLPDGRAKSTCMTNLQQSSMWANYGIAELAPVEIPKPVDKPKQPVTAKPAPPPSQ
jgi:hypothetical protein